MLPGQETWTPTPIPGQELRSHMGSQKNKHTQIPNLNYLLQAQRGQFITELFFFLIHVYFLATLSSMWDISFPTRDQPMPPGMEAQVFNHWTTSELPITELLKN